jgi:hypothetical protein
MKTKITFEENRKKYRIPSGASYQLRSKDAVYFGKNESVKHIISKCLGAYMIKKYGDVKFTNELIESIKSVENEVNETFKDWTIKNKDSFITEAVIKKIPDRRVDLVRLSDNTHFEFELKKTESKENAISIYI